MEDEFGVAYQQTADEKDLEYAFFGIFDGHGGREAALFAKVSIIKSTDQNKDYTFPLFCQEHLMDFIVRQKGFWAEDDDSVLKAIHEGYIQTHYAMWKELGMDLFTAHCIQIKLNSFSTEKWPKTASGLPSTAGTTASIAFIRRGKIYVGHVGDSAIVLGTQDEDNPDIWVAEPLTRDHKPESLEESERITQCGGKVVCKSGVPRVVWNRPKMGHKGPVRRSTHIDEIPFLAVARSLGDLWSYNSEENVFVVSPEPDIRVYPVDISRHRCLVLATDGCWNMLTPQNAISTVCSAEKANEQHMLAPVEGHTAWINPSKQLVDCAIDRWTGSKLRADNTSVVTVMLDPPGPPRAQVLKTRKRELAELNNGRELPTVPGVSGSVALVTNTTQEPPHRLQPQFDLNPEAAPAPAPADLPASVSRQPEEGHVPPQPHVPRVSPAVSDNEDSDVSTSSDRSSDNSPPPSASSDIVQCNEISSSEDSPSRSRSRDSESRAVEAVASTSPHAPTQASRGRPSLARELSSLRLSSPQTPARSTRSVHQSANSSSKTPRVVAKKNPHTPKSLLRSGKRKAVSKMSTVGVQQRVKNIEAKLDSIEKKVSTRTAQITQTSAATKRLARSHQSSASSGSDPSEVSSKALRSRTPVTSKSKPQTPTSIKRKRTATPKREIETRKSPRTIVSQLPKVTHSKQAKVLRLKRQ